MRNEWRDQEEANGGREFTDLHRTIVQEGDGPE